MARYRHHLAILWRSHSKKIIAIVLLACFYIPYQLHVQHSNYHTSMEVLRRNSYVTAHNSHKDTVDMLKELQSRQSTFENNLPEKISNFRNKFQDFDHRKPSYDHPYPVLLSNESLKHIEEFNTKNVNVQYNPLYSSNKSVQTTTLRNIHQSNIVNDSKKQIPRTINKELPVIHIHKNESIRNKLRPCEKHHDELSGRLKPLMKELKIDELEKLFPGMRLGGSHTPDYCTPKEKTAIIIPFRNRQHHLLILLRNLIPILVRQKIDFTIFIIDQLLPGPFNRGMLHNVGFLEASKLGDFTCFIFHDVDLIPVHDHNLYHCNPKNPSHFSMAIDKFNYSPKFILKYKVFGGAVAFTDQQFRKINGLSNFFFGWGGEDDDLRIRVENKGFTIDRRSPKIGIYDMVKHKRDNSNGKNPVRNKMLKFTTKKQDIEGLNSTRYKLVGIDKQALYTRVQVLVNITQVLKEAPTYMNDLTKSLLEVFDEKSRNKSSLV